MSNRLLDKFSNCSWALEQPTDHKGNRSEFVRLAIEEKLERDMVQFQNRASAIPKRI